MLKFLIPLVALALVAHPADAAKKRKHAARQAPAAAKTDGPRMIEIRPGYWISTWGCYTDDGYGRIGPCDGRDGTD
jgi:hypothetical protein